MSPEKRSTSASQAAASPSPAARTMGVRSCEGLDTEKKLVGGCITGAVPSSVADPVEKEEHMQRLGQRIRTRSIVRGITALGTLAMVWVAAAAPYEGMF